MKRLPIYLAALLLAPTASQAQTTDTRLAADAIKVENMKVEKSNSNLMVDLDLNMSELDLRSNARLVFTPMVKDKNGSNQVLMPQILVSGRKSDISYRRSGHKDYADDAVAVRRKNNTEQTVHYTAVVPYQDWMRNSDVVIAEDLCGCNEIEEQNTHIVKRLRQPNMPYLRPAAEAQKQRSEQGRAFIDFPVDRVELHPNYRKNPTELQKIIETINLVKNDKNTTITNIDIHGYASPESPYEHNAYLAENRAKTLREYVSNLVQLPGDKFTVSSTPEDWEGLREAVAASNLEHKQAILELIDDGGLDPDVKEQRIKSKYPADYRFMLSTYYPALRHSDYVVSYTVKPFSVEEAKEVLKTKPQQLSLEEMFMVAQTYEPGSKEFNDVMETAVRLYPQDQTANGACRQLSRGYPRQGCARHDKGRHRPSQVLAHPSRPGWREGSHGEPEAGGVACPKDSHSLGVTLPSLGSLSPTLWESSCHPIPVETWRAASQQTRGKQKEKEAPTRRDAFLRLSKQGRTSEKEQPPPRRDAFSRLSKQGKAN